MAAAASSQRVWAAAAARCGEQGRVASSWGRAGGGRPLPEMDGAVADGGHHLVLEG